jgi:lipid-binding SYLF domain-containing protein
MPAETVDGLAFKEPPALACPVLQMIDMKLHIVGNLVALATLSLALAACSSNESARSPEKVSSERATTATRLDSAAALLSDFRQNIPDPIASRAHCVVIVPRLVKGGLLVGGQSGNGFTACKTSAGWSAPAPITVSGGSLGAQVGVESTDLLALVMTESAKYALEGGNFKVGTDASAAAGPVTKGRAAPDLEAKGDFLSYTHSNTGLYAGVSLTGTNLKPDQDATFALYGAPLELRSILEGQAPLPNEPAAQRFAAALARALPSGRVAQR